MIVAAHRQQQKFGNRSVTASDRYKVLFKPIRVGPKTMRNRFYKVRTALASERSGLARKPASGASRPKVAWAVVNTESCSVHPSTGEFPLAGGRMWDDEAAAHYKLRVDTAHNNKGNINERHI